MQLDYRCYVHFRDTAAFERALEILTVQTTGGAFSFQEIAETFRSVKRLGEALNTPLGVFRKN